MPITVTTEPSWKLRKRKPHPLVLAAKHGHEEIVKILLAKGCRTHIRDFGNLSLLSSAVIGNHINLVQMFLALGVKQDGNSATKSTTPIRLAASSGNEQIVKLLLSESENNILSGQQLQVALEIAFEIGLQAGQIRVISALLEHGLDLNFGLSLRGGDYGQTPPGWAIVQEKLKQVQEFPEKGFDPSDALLEAAEKGQDRDGQNANPAPQR